MLLGVSQSLIILNQIEKEKKKKTLQREKKTCVCIHLWLAVYLYHISRLMQKYAFIWLDIFPNWIRYHMPSKVRDEIIYAFPSFNCIVEVWN